MLFGSSHATEGYHRASKVFSSLIAPQSLSVSPLIISTHGSPHYPTQEANKFLAKPADFAAEIRKQGDASAREGVERVLEVLVTTHCKTYQDCVDWVRLHFQEVFHNRIAQLTYTFPEDAKTSQVHPPGTPSN